MDTSQIVVLVGGVALIALTLWFFFGQREGEDKVAQASTEALYACPMHPWITSDKPGDTCSICGMGLVRSDAANPRGRELPKSV